MRVTAGASRASATAPAHLNTATGPAQLTALRDRFEQTILTQIDECGINGAGAPRVSNTNNLYFNHLEAEALVIATEWNEFANVDFAAVKQRMTTPIVFDGRNLLNPETMGELGFHYHSIGRASVLPR